MIYRLEDGVVVAEYGFPMKLFRGIGLILCVLIGSQNATINTWKGGNMAMQARDRRLLRSQRGYNVLH